MDIPESVAQASGAAARAAQIVTASQMRQAS
jgi:heterodisulfide reductase subunit A-like polyferredoxin